MVEKILTAPQVRRLRRMCENHVPAGAIATVFGIDRTTVRYLMRRHGIEDAKPVPKRLNIPKPDKTLAQAILFLRRRGHHVFNAAVVGQPNDLYYIDGLLVTPDDLIERGQPK